MDNNIKKELEDITRNVLKDSGNHNEIDFEKGLREEGLGLSSIDSLKLFTEVEKSFDIEIPESYWGLKTFKNLNELLSFIANEKN